MGQDRVVSIATRYRLDGTGIEHQRGKTFSPGAHPASNAMRTGSFLGVKQPRQGVDEQPPSNAEVKERVELYLFYPSRPLWPVTG